MAMTSVSKRKLEDYIMASKDLRATQAVGPGTYSPKPFDKAVAYQNMRAPPFLSKEHRWSPDKTDNPGPGAYNLAGNLNKGKVLALGIDKGNYYLKYRLSSFFSRQC